MKIRGFILSHTSEDHMVDVIEGLEEELEHWQNVLAGDDSNDKAGRRSAALFYFLCDLEVPGYEAPQNEALQAVHN